MEIIQSIALDFAQNATQATIFAKQYDKDTRKIEITPLNNGSPYTIDTDVTARLQMTKSDGTTVINNAEISSGKITVVLTAQALTSAGTAVAEIGLYKGSTLLSSQTFYIDVQKGAYDEDAPESSDEYNALVEALGEAEQATATAEAASERAEAAVDSANTAIETARTVATGKMSLIPIDPTVEEIEAMPSGQIYGDTVNHKGIVKDGQEFYDTAAIDALLSNKQGTISAVSALSKYGGDYVVGELYIYENGIYRYRGTNFDINLGSYNVFNRISGGFYRSFFEPRNTFQNLECPYRQGDIFAKIRNSNNSGILKLYRCTSLYEYASYNTYYCEVTWTEIPLNIYSKTEVNNLFTTKENTANKVTSLSSSSTDDQYPTAKCVYDMIGDIESLLAEV